MNDDWEKFLRKYLKKNHPDILLGMNTDPETGVFVAYYTITDEHEKRADKLVNVIIDLIEKSPLPLVNS